MEYHYQCYHKIRAFTFHSMYEYIGVTLTNYEEKLMILKFLVNQLIVYTTALISPHNPTTFSVICNCTHFIDCLQCIDC